MSIFFSPSRCGFYLPEIHGAAMPQDALAIPAEMHEALLAGQQSGKQIAAGQDGYPILIEPAATPPGPPAAVALWQFRRELQARGWWGQVQAAIAALPAEARADVVEWLEYGTEVQRASPLLRQLAEAIGVSGEIDAAFAAAAARVL